jgi:hypothetical protein
MEIANYNDAFASFGAAAAALSGDQKAILKFDKGDWYAGQDSTEIKHGTELAVDIMNAEWGWVRWSNAKPAERRMVMVASGQVPAPRDSLGHSDERMWDVDKEGKARDPWQRTIELPVREVSGERREFTMAGSSKGFEGACKRLFKAFSEGVRANAGKIPVITLGADTYKHPNFGMVKVPDLKVTGWRVAEELEAKETKPKVPAKF